MDSIFSKGRRERLTFDVEEVAEGKSKTGECGFDRGDDGAECGVIFRHKHLQGAFVAADVEYVAQYHGLAVHERRTLFRAIDDD